jgi:cysteine desulfurase
VIDLPVYLDNHATTRPAPRVLTALAEAFANLYGNPSSLAHAPGRAAADAVEKAREQASALVGADPRAIVFTSGATESNNLALKGAAWAARAASGRDHLVTTDVEHKAVLAPLKRLAAEGFSLTVLKADRAGRVEPEQVQTAITERTALVSIIAANNEIGTINPIAAIGEACRARGALFHSDATQAVGRVPLDLSETAIDLLSFSSHKLYGPKGVGALYVRRGAPVVRIVPLNEGGGQERGLRGGTLPAPLIVGFGLACAIAAEEPEAEAARVGHLRDRLERGLRERLPDMVTHGHPTERLAGNLNAGFPGVDGERLLLTLRDVAVSSGAACTSASPEASHVLRAIGVPEELARASLRFGVGRYTTEEEIDFAIEAVAAAVLRCRTVVRGATGPNRASGIP